METVVTGHSPFAALTLIVAPAMLTNASCVLAMSTINRMLRTRERMRELLKESESVGAALEEVSRNTRQVDRVERQAVLLMGALASIYVALGSFALATLVSLLGAALATTENPGLFGALAIMGFALGFVGVTGIVIGSARLFHATQLSLLNIREEAEAIRRRRQERA